MPYAYSPNNLVQTADENSKALVRCEIALTGIEVEDGDVRGGKNRRLIWPSRNPKKDIFPFLSTSPLVPLWSQYRVQATLQ